MLTSLNLSKSANEPANELDQQHEAELEQEKQTLIGRTAELARIDAADPPITAALTAAENEVRRAHDPLNDVDQPGKDAAMARMRKARQAKQKADADRAAFGHTRESLAEDANALGRKSALLEQRRIRAAIEALQPRKIKAGLEFEAIEAEERALHARANIDWPADDGDIVKGAGLPVLLLPAGTFTKAAPLPGHRLKSIFESYLVLAVACYPHLAQLLPPDRAAAIREELEGIYARGTINFAGRAPWHFSETFGARGIKLATGEVRRQVAGVGV